MIFYTHRPSLVNDVIFLLEKNTDDAKYIPSQGPLQHGSCWKCSKRSVQNIRWMIICSGACTGRWLPYIHRPYLVNDVFFARKNKTDNWKYIASQGPLRDGSCWKYSKRILQNITWMIICSGACTGECTIPHVDTVRRQKKTPIFLLFYFWFFFILFLFFF